jgi:hypothetical protein
MLFSRTSNRAHLAQRLVGRRASYDAHIGMVRENMANLSAEDQEVMQRMLLEEQELDADVTALSYEELLDLGEQMGQVKTERW